MATGRRSARYNVVAEYRDLESARRALERLQLHGVEAANISISGGAAREAADDTSQRNMRTRDLRLGERVLARSLAGASAGGTIGAILAAIGVGIALAAADYGAGIWIPIAFGAGILIGITGGGMGAAAVSLPLTPDYDLTYATEHDRHGEVFVSVHSERQEDIERAQSLLQEKQALRLRRFNGTALEH
jgi:hypothetical protein